MLKNQFLFLVCIFAGYLASVLFYLLQSVVKKKIVHRCAFALVLAAFALQTVLLAERWLAAGFLPVTNLFSTLFFFSWALAATYVYFELRYRIGASGLFVMGVNLLLLGTALPRDPALPLLFPS